MNATELRLGNIIVSPVDGRNIIVDRHDLKAIELKQTFNGKSYRPLPITEKSLALLGILLKQLGDTTERYFDFSHTCFSHQGGTIIVSYRAFLLKNGALQIRYCADVNRWYPLMTELTYVHEFQNLFFALTGREMIMSTQLKATI